MKSMKSLLAELDIIDTEQLEIFSTRTRDQADLCVLRDTESGVIFIDGFLTEQSSYASGSYREELKKIYGARHHEINIDVSRRIKDYKQFYVGKNILDFGCGEGSFLRGIMDLASSVSGLEIQTVYIDELKNDGINCLKGFQDIGTELYDTIFCFHTLEHLDQPIQVLEKFKSYLKPGGTLIVEVPHARDFLLSALQTEDFKNFTLWSQHLILHTRDSLGRFFRAAGFENFIIQARQRYPLSNHLNWLKNKKPGGHKSILSVIDTDELSCAYEKSLQMIDATDTLIAIVQNT